MQHNMCVSILNIILIRQNHYILIDYLMSRKLSQDNSAANVQPPKGIA